MAISENLKLQVEGKLHQDACTSLLIWNEKHDECANIGGDHLKAWYSYSSSSLSFGAALPDTHVLYKVAGSLGRFGWRFWFSSNFVRLQSSLSNIWRLTELYWRAYLL